MRKYYETLTEPEREKLFAVMRKLTERALAADAEHRKLRPVHGTIGIGCADFDPLLRSVVIFEFLRGLNIGDTPQLAHIRAKDAGRECVRLWNVRGSRGRAFVSGRYELERWTESGDRIADEALAATKFAGMAQP